MYTLGRDYVYPVLTDLVNCTNVNNHEGTNRTVLLGAIRANRSDAVNYLLGLGAVVPVAALIDAFWYYSGDNRIVQQLLDAKPSLAPMAVELGLAVDVRLLQYLVLEYGIDITLAYESGGRINDPASMLLCGIGESRQLVRQMLADYVPPVDLLDMISSFLSTYVYTWITLLDTNYNAEVHHIAFVCP